MVFFSVMRNTLAFIAFILCQISVAQSVFEFKGTVIDKNSGEALIGSTALYAPGKGAIADIEGKFTLLLKDSTYRIAVSFVGFETKEVTVTMTGPKTLTFELEPITLREVEVVADIAQSRKTPVAFSSISPKMLKEELGARDIPLILNNTPGVYATQQGGGDGDSRITIRGFDQNNLAVMVDGVPVNDMENGWVYWSNWFGLDLVTKQIQVQRGLSASKLALPSVGGTINILSQGIDSKKFLSVQQDISSGNRLRTTIGYNSGRLKNGWGFTLAGSFKKGDGIVDQTFTEGYFYFAKVEKLSKKHRWSLSAMGAPQKHGQRAFKGRIADYDTEYAREQGVPDSILDATISYGRNYNKYYGYYTNDQYEFDIDTIQRGGRDLYSLSNVDTITGNRTLINERVNYYHKPQFTLRDFWTINDKITLINTAYVSLGTGGGTAAQNSSSITYNPATGQQEWQDAYSSNYIHTSNSNNGFTGVYPEYDSTGIRANNFLRSSINNHKWFGYISNVNIKHNDTWSSSFGLDLRRYKGEHYRTPYDFLGADYYLSNDNQNENSVVVREGDPFLYHDEGIVNWQGIFGQVEYNNELYNAFVNVTASNTGYKAIDYFRRKTLVVGDTTIEVGADGVTYNGQFYDQNSPGLKTYETEWVNILGYTIKAGFNYNFTEYSNGFINLGMLNRAPKFNGVIDISNDIIEDYENEIVKSVELGYSYSKEKLSIDVNAYNTKWENKSINRNIAQAPPEGSNIDPTEEVNVFIRDMDALHRGLEVFAAYALNPKLKVQTVVSIGDWTWQSQEDVQYTYQGKAVLDDEGKPITLSIDPRGVHVGDAAQTQLGLSFEYKPMKGLYTRARYTFYDRHFANFDPSSVVGDNAGRESWKTPAYGLLDLHLGYNFTKRGNRWGIRFSMYNVLNTFYISDAQNNDSFISPQYNDFDAKSASVFPGLGRNFNVSLSLKI
jgi:hypothetical protein